jgi:hypothetical protein
VGGNSFADENGRNRARNRGFNFTGRKKENFLTQPFKTMSLKLVSLYLLLHHLPS